MSIQLILYIIIIGTLLYVNFFGSTIAGTNRWIDFGFFSFQPSEYAKIIVIMLTAFIFSDEFLIERYNVKELVPKKKTKKIIQLLIQFKNNRQIKLVLINILFVLPFLVLTFIQPALGNTIIILLLWFLTLILSLDNTKDVLKYLILFLLLFMLAFSALSLNSQNSEINFQNPFFEIKGYVFLISFLLIFIISKIKIWKALIVVFGVILSISSLIVGWNFGLGQYQRDRIINFVSGPEADPLGGGYQVIQSKIAIGSGQLFGRGYFKGTQSNLNILTQAETDFAFASLAEQFGFLGSILLLSIYLFLILRILRVAKSTPDNFGKVISFGVSILLLIHLFINIGMNIGKLPVTGIPLPLISYGGSSVIMTFILMGLVQSVYSSRKPVDMADGLMLTSLKHENVPN